MDRDLNQKGFTLVELAMVLLIITLITTGIFKASELVENSEIDRLINDMQGFQIAYYAYYDRTAAYPGTSNGNQVNFDSAIDDTDGGTFFQEIFDESFTKSPRPLAKLVSPGFYFINYLDVSETVTDTTGAMIGQNQICVTQLETKHALHIDARIDDGLWNEGQLRSVTDYSTQDKHTVCLEI